MGDSNAIDAQKKIINRLRRAQGQLAAVVTAMEGGAGCRDVVTQLAAVSSALDRAGFQIVATAMKDCLGNDEAGQGSDAADLSLDELERLFLSLA
ncbi:metal-sensitive transcriptional regulator [Gryllotalpicola sp.]|uniref:metal-sensitive transcriptional regulator n=1 Tax=Gryllotalpicola sp. TaxID=1932787 RepID=UPI00261E1E41|nr:metal-sensitive transcriptional regulator [Gryllotalpicola sp.]